ncbi:hypothetical protein [Kitasatospora sp. NPDC058478]|uniref:hypothetical protein n=1 Tax=unclassified Kitasatospora TaxID=2633591 RepID=UPI00365B5D8A
MSSAGSSPWFSTPALVRQHAADAAETVAAYATLHTGALGIHAPHPGWTGAPDGTAHYDGHGLRFTYRPAAGTQPPLTARVVGGCGTEHTFPVTGPRGLAADLQNAADCTGHPAGVVTLAAARATAW